MTIAVEGFSDEVMEVMNRFRHLVAAPAWAMGSKINVKQMMPLPTDKAATVKESMTKEEFLALSKMYKIKAKA